MNESIGHIQPGQPNGGPDWRSMLNTGGGGEPPHRGKPKLRPDYRLMSPEEMTPEERWDEILDLLTLMALPKNAKRLGLAEEAYEA